MPHIHTDPGQHDLTASAFIVRVDLNEPSLMLHRHKSLDMWMHFGGHVELDENLWRTVIRELREESGYDMTQLKLLQPDIQRPRYSDAISHPWPVAILTVKYKTMDHLHTDIAYAFTANVAPAHKTGESESGKFMYFTRDELVALTEAEILPNIRSTSLKILDDYLKNWSQVTPN